MTALTERHCTPCEGDQPPMSQEEALRLLPDVPDWRLEDDALVLDTAFPDFQAALDWVNRVGAVAEREGHHPDLWLPDYRHVRTTLSTHAIGGLSENDFILAAKIDRVPR